MSATILDKHRALARERPLKLDLGCGTAKRASPASSLVTELELVKVR